MEPSFGAVVETEAASRPLRLEWKDSGGATRFQVQVARDAEFRSVTHDLVSSQAFLEIQGLPEGELHWRVRASEGSGAAKWSTTSRFHIQARLLPDPPLLTEPPHGSVLTQAQFSWQAGAGHTQFVLEIAPDADFRQVLVAEQLQRTSYFWQPDQAGQYWWRVRAVREDGRSTVHSAIRSFQVK
jgi:predicted phage tail protein